MGGGQYPRGFAVYILLRFWIWVQVQSWFPLKWNLQGIIWKLLPTQTLQFHVIVEDGLVKAAPRQNGNHDGIVGVLLAE